MSRGLRRNTTECEREAQRWLKELQHEDYSVACMERLLEEITAPESDALPALHQQHGVSRMKKPMCPTCATVGAYCAELDRYYCQSCDIWLEAPCDCVHDTCGFAQAQRQRGDAKPSEITCPPQPGS